MNRRRLALSAAAACLLVAIPATPVALMGYTRYRPAMLLLLLLRWRVVYFLAPGFIVSMSLAPLEPFFLHHPRALSVVPLFSVLISVLFWTAIFYGLLSAHTHLRSRRHSREG